MRSTFKASFDFNGQISASVDYQVDLPSAPDTSEDFQTGGEWDVAVWDVSVWDSSGTTTISSKWSSVGRSGFVVSPQVQVTCGYSTYPELELIVSEAIFEVGGVMV